MHYIYFETAFRGSFRWIRFIYISPATIKVILKTVKGTAEISRKQLWKNSSFKIPPHLSQNSTWKSDQYQCIFSCIILAINESKRKMLTYTYISHLAFSVCCRSFLLTLHGDYRGVWRGGGREGRGRWSVGSPFSVSYGPWSPTHWAQQVSELCGSWI